jgi:hypothetical protein
VIKNDEPLPARGVERSSEVDELVQRTAASVKPTAHLRVTGVGELAHRLCNVRGHLEFPGDAKSDGSSL